MVMENLDDSFSMSQGLKFFVGWVYLIEDLLYRESGDPVAGQDSRGGATKRQSIRPTTVF
jgi:hypothetical protein